MTRYLITLALAIAAAILTPVCKGREGHRLSRRRAREPAGRGGCARQDPFDPPARRRASRPGEAHHDSSTGEHQGAFLGHCIPVMTRKPTPRRCPCRYASLSAPLTSFRPHGTSSTPSPRASSCLHREASSRSKATPTPSAARPTTSSCRECALKQCVTIWCECHGIDAARLKTVAYGESRPIEGSNPNDAVNRRVQFRGA